MITLSETDFFRHLQIGQDEKKEISPSNHWNFQGQTCEGLDPDQWFRGFLEPVFSKGVFWSSKWRHFWGVGILREGSCLYFLFTLSLFERFDWWCLLRIVLHIWSVIFVFWGKCINHSWIGKYTVRPMGLFRLMVLIGALGRGLNFGSVAKQVVAMDNLDKPWYFWATYFLGKMWHWGVPVNYSMNFMFMGFFWNWKPDDNV